jgi:hypothetical protein
LLTVAAGAHAPLAAVEGRGVLAASCGDPSAAAPAHVLLTPASDKTPIDAWDVAVTAASPCGGAVAEICAGKGTLATGVDIGSCAPALGTGHLGSVVVCTPGPAMQQGAIARQGSAPFGFDADSLSVTGNLQLVLAGDAADEAQNICV